MNNEIDILIKETGKQLHNLRLNAGLTRYELELLSGVDTSTIIRYEKGDTSQNICKLNALLKSLNADMTIFFETVYANMGKHYEKV